MDLACSFHITLDSALTSDLSIDLCPILFWLLPEKTSMLYQQTWQENLSFIKNEPKPNADLRRTLAGEF